MPEIQPNCSKKLGIVIVTYNSEDVIRDCLDSLRASSFSDFSIVVVDNTSNDHTCDIVRDWARVTGVFQELQSDEIETKNPLNPADTILVRSGVNRGYAGGVNLGLRYHLLFFDTHLFWILNPDCRVLPDTAAKFVSKAKDLKSFGLMGGRVLYVSPPEIIQSDGGRVNLWTGICANINLGKDAATAPYPNASNIQYISGANLVVSREFIDYAGAMKEDYFLYFEEVDWAFRRGHFSIAYAEDAIVQHHAGTSIGSPVIGKEHGTSFSNYFNYRNRLRFMWRFFPLRLPVAYIYSALKVLRLTLQGHWHEADGAFRGLHGLKPPDSVRLRLSKDAYKIATGKKLD